MPLSNQKKSIRKAGDGREAGSATFSYFPEFLGQRGPQKFGSWSVTLLPSGFGKACPTN